MINNETNNRYGEKCVRTFDLVSMIAADHAHTLGRANLYSAVEFSFKWESDLVEGDADPGRISLAIDGYEIYRTRRQPKGVVSSVRIANDGDNYTACTDEAGLEEALVMANFPLLFATPAPVTLVVSLPVGTKVGVTYTGILR